MFKLKHLAAMNPNMTDTLIGEGTVFEGTVRSEASIRIEGHIIGDVECAGDVIVGEHGVLTSDIRARDVILAGTVTGNIQTKGKLTITATGTLCGNINAAAFIIEEGGVFQGASTMEARQKAGQAAASAESDKGSRESKRAQSAFQEEPAPV